MFAARTTLRLFVAGALLPFAWPAVAQNAAPGKLPPGLHEIAWNRGAAVLETEVAAGKFVEWCGPLRAGDRVDWKYDASAPLDMNIHYHQGKEVVYPAKVEASRAAANALQAAGDQHYCWMWSNKGAAAVKLSAELKRP